jgi:hypothetical protein
MTVGHRAHVQFGRLQRQGQRQGIVDVIADVGVENDGNAFLRPARRAEYKEKRNQQFAHALPL